MREVNYDYKKAVKKITSALSAQGFGILIEIDVKATFKKEN